MSAVEAVGKVDSPYFDYPVAEVPRAKTLPPIPRAAHFITAPDIVLACVCESYGVELDALKFGSKVAPLAEARIVAYWLLRTVAKLSWNQVGVTLGRDHTSAMKGTRTALKMREARAEFLAFTDELAMAVAARIGLT